MTNDLNYLYHGIRPKRERDSGAKSTQSVVQKLVTTVIHTGEGATGPRKETTLGMFYEDVDPAQGQPVQAAVKALVAASLYSNPIEQAHKKENLEEALGRCAHHRFKGKADVRFAAHAINERIVAEVAQVKSEARGR